jgi:small-conductance mechanosensitive channel
MLGESYGIVVGFVRGIVFGIVALTILESRHLHRSFLATLGISSLAIALALQETLKNGLSGLFLIVDSPVQVGDYVKLSSGQEGWLTQLGWRSSKFRMMNDNMVIVPNSQLVDAIFTNLRARDGALSIEIDISVAGGGDLEHVERVTSEIASSVMAAVDGDHASFALFKRECDRDGGICEYLAQRRHRENQARIHQTADGAVRERGYQAGVSATFHAGQ